MLLAGLAANLLIPVSYILGVSLVMDAWHNPDEVQNILVGLALVASMPIAGSSTAWSQNADGDLALSLGLVLGSTLLSPLTTPLALHAVGFMARGDYAEDLHELAAGGAGAFLAVGVILPSLLGIALRQCAGERRVTAAKPALKLVNTGVLLFLNYFERLRLAAPGDRPARPGLPRRDARDRRRPLRPDVRRRVVPRPAVPGSSRPARCADVRAGDEQQRDRAGDGLAGAGGPPAGAAADHLLQPRAAPRGRGGGPHHPGRRGQAAREVTSGREDETAPFQVVGNQGHASSMLLHWMHHLRRSETGDMKLGTGSVGRVFGGTWWTRVVHVVTLDASSQEIHPGRSRVPTSSTPP